MASDENCSRNQYYAFTPLVHFSKRSIFAFYSPEAYPCICADAVLDTLNRGIQVTKSVQSEGLKTARLLMVLSSISPLFLLWAIRGSKLIPDRYLISFCVAMVILPNLFLWLRIRTARRLQEKRELVVGSAEDHRDHLLVYLFAMLLPFYPIDTGTWRDFAALISALGFVVFLFWHLNLHYMNLIFAVRGYRVFTISPPKDENAYSGRTSQVLITSRVSLLADEHIIAYRLSDSVYFEVEG
ncbi:MAG TPA: hypothetical protein VFA89_20855 [Terriglobales bacterium]|nr:hypothetical protein [Terriglobales bacterium]